MAVIDGHPDFPFMLFHNRDEEWDRDTEDPGVYHESEGHCVYARDTWAGGTFLGLNLSVGLVAALTNIRTEVPRPQPNQRQGGSTSAPLLLSRGQLVLSAMQATHSQSEHNF